MISRYEVFCRAVELGGFTKAAKYLNYSQSAVSQTVKALEQELGTVLVERRKDGVVLTEDGKLLTPYIQSVFLAEQALLRKKMEVQGLTNSVIRIGTFTSISRSLLPRMMKNFKVLYPSAQFVLQQGEYTSIEKWVKEGSVDFGFVNTDAVSEMDGRIIMKDKMMAVLPKGHPLAEYGEVSLHQLTSESFILLDEGSYSLPLYAFEKLGLVPRIGYKVYDDYTILAMVKHGLGISMMYQTVLDGFGDGLEIRPIKENPERSIALVWSKWDTMPLAARKFVQEIINRDR